LLHLAQARGLTAETPIIDETERLKIALARANADIKSLAHERDTAEAIRTEIYNLASRTPEPPDWLLGEIGKGAKSGTPGTPMTIWSDWHWGEVVKPEEVGGVNEFNAEVAERRVRELVRNTIDLCRNHTGRLATKFPGIVVMLGGDMITGTIHEELANTNDRTTQQSINDLSDVLIWALEKMADEFGKVFVPCVVGNHGRSTKRTVTKGRVYTSHEWNIYCNLERHFRRDKRVQFYIPNESDAYFRVYNHRFLLTHGDGLGVKGGDGIIGAIGPIMRGTLKTSKSEAQIGRDFDTIVMGHWHQMLWLPGAIVNNCLKGYDEFARLFLRAPYSAPSQALWLVHPKWGITARWEIKLEAGQVAAARDGEWITWQP
jgi:predicted phosphodiesterase